MIAGSVALLAALSASGFAGGECQTILERARQAYESRQYGVAVSEFQRALPACNQAPAALNGLGQAQLMAGNFAESIATLDRLLAREPRNVSAMKLKADAQYLLGHDHDAESTLLRAIETDPRGQDAIYALGRMYYQQARYDAAIEQFRKVLALDPKSYKAYDNLGLCYEGLNDNPQAIRNYLSDSDLVFKDHPEYDWTYGNLANLMLKLGEYRKAFDLSVEAAKRNPNSARNCFLTGKALVKLDKPELSERWLKRASELDPDYAEPRYLLSQVYRQLGRQEDARRELEAFQEIGKRMPRKRR